MMIFMYGLTEPRSSLGQCQMVHLTEEESGQSKGEITKTEDAKQSSISAKPAPVCHELAEHDTSFEWLLEYR